MAKIKVKLVTSILHSKEDETETHYGLEFKHLVSGEGKDAVHSLVCEADEKLVKSLLDAKIVVKV